MLYIAYFSPTGTTRRIAASVGKALFEIFLCRAQVVDLTPPAARLRGRTFAEEDVVVFGAPVYGGRVPPLLLPALRLWNGGGAKAVVLSVWSIIAIFAVRGELLGGRWGSDECPE